MRGLRSPHLQTIVASLFRPRHAPSVRRERWDTHDGDFVDVDVLDAAPGRPRLLVLHGLEGSSQAGYVAAVLREAHRHDMGAYALNFRSCSGEPNRLARSYHSGETTDALFAVRKIQERDLAPIFGIGFSLGSNVLLKLMGEAGDAVPLSGAVGISVPFDLAECARALDGPGAWAFLYRNVFLRSLVTKALRMANQFPGLIDVERLRKATTLTEFDDVVTAPLHGFSGAQDYYARSSCGSRLRDIRRPTLILHADDDPFIPLSSVPRDVISANPSLQAIITSGGGHVGFVEGRQGRPDYWAEKVAVKFAAHVLESQRS
jgi:predicted alpha/beta-fold hydrolase